MQRTVTQGQRDGNLPTLKLDDYGNSIQSSPIENGNLSPPQYIHGKNPNFVLNLTVWSDLKAHLNSDRHGRKRRRHTIILCCFCQL